MKKLLTAFILLFMVSSAASTTVASENVTVDIESSTVEIDVRVKELTSSSFSYITSYSIDEADAVIGGEPAECSVKQLQTGSEINCQTERNRNFDVEMNFSGENLVSSRNGANTFRYTQSFYRPTDEFRLKVILPQGTGIKPSGNSTSSVSPREYNTGSNGRRIFVEWVRDPRLGQTLNFELKYEKLSSRTNYLKIAGVIGAVSVFLAALYIFWKRSKRKDIESIYEKLSDDEIEVIEILRENNGSMLQKDVVNESSYSKAKISGVVSSLVEKEIVEKKKEGRSNKLDISGVYRS